MKKLIFFSVLGLISLGAASSVHAQSYTSAYCPAGYVCTPISYVPSCPTGYVCTPINPSPVPTPVPTPTSCYVFTRNIGIGTYMTADETRALVNILMNEGVWPYNVDTLQPTYNYMASAAVARFQSKYGISATGFLGPLTRTRMNSIAGCSTSPYNNAPVITSISGPTSLSLGQSGTWTVNAYDPDNNTSMTYSVDWGESTYPTCNYPYTCNAAAVSPSYFQTSTFTHVYSNAGTYNVTFTVRDGTGLTVTKTATVVVGGGTTASPLAITSPNGGESWQTGSYQYINWTSPYYFRATYADLKLVPYYAPCTTTICPMSATSAYYPYRAPYTIATSLSINQNSYNWHVGDVQSGVSTYQYTYSGNGYSTQVVPDGQYTIQICETGTSNCDSSNAPFTIYSGNSNTNRSPVISSVTAPTSLTVGQVGTWSVSAYDPENGPLTYSIRWGDEGSYSYPTYGSAALGAYTQSTTFTHSYSSQGTYTVVVTVKDQYGNTTQSTASVQVGGTIYGSGVMRVLSPNGGESYTRGNTALISWSGGYSTNNVRITLTHQCPAGMYCIALAYPNYVISNSTANSGSYIWTVGNASLENGAGATVLSGNYIVTVCRLDIPQQSSSCDSSDTPFTVN